MINLDKAILTDIENITECDFLPEYPYTFKYEVGVTSYIFERNDKNHQDDTIHLAKKLTILARYPNKRDIELHDSFRCNKIRVFYLVAICKEIWSPEIKELEEWELDKLLVTSKNYYNSHLNPNRL